MVVFAVHKLFYFIRSYLLIIGCDTCATGDLESLPGPLVQVYSPFSLVKTQVSY